MIPPLVLRIYADSTGVAAGVAKTQKQVTGLRGSMQRNSALIKTALIGGVVVGLKASVDAALESQKANLKLQNSLENSKVVAMSARDAFIAQANALRDLTGVDDEAIVGAQAFLVQMGLTEEQIRSLTPLVVDLSEKMGVDLETAAKAVGKSVNGTTGGLQRMGVVVNKTKAETDAYGATLDALGVAQGFAAKQAKNEPWRLLKAEFEELGETVGEAILPGLKALARQLNEWRPALRFLGRNLPAIAGGLLLLWTVGKIGKLAGTFRAIASATRLSTGALGAWGVAIGLVAAAAFKLQGYIKQDDEQGQKWARNVIRGNSTLRDWRQAVDDVSDGHVNLIDHLDGTAKTMQALDHTIRQVNQAFYGQVATLIDNTTVGARWERQLRDSGAMTIQQKQNLAALLQTTMDYNVKLSDSQRVTLEAYLATGDYRSALALLKNALSGVLGPLRNLLTYTERQGEAAGDAAQKNQRYVYWLKQLGDINVPNYLPPGTGNPQQRQHGGPVGAMRPYVVGEAGPELFVPNGSGQIVPNNQLATSSAPQVINLYIGDEKVETVVVKALSRAAVKG